MQNIMTSDQLKKHLKSHGIGGFWKGGIRLFDTEYYLPELSKIDALVAETMKELEDKGLSPYTAYAKNYADCDDFSLWFMSGVTQRWALENAGKKEFPAIAFGRALVTGHEMNIAVTTSGIKIYNYGQKISYDLSKIKEVGFK